MITEMLDYLKRGFGLDLKDSPKVLSRLKKQAISLKESISSTCSASFTIDYLDYALNDLDQEYEMNREEFDVLAQPIFDEVLVHVHQAMVRSGLRKNQIREIVLVGGSCRLPKF